MLIAHSRFYRSFPETMLPATDALANRIYELAHAFASARRANKGNPTVSSKGLKLRKSDLQQAIHWINRISRE